MKRITGIGLLLLLAALDALLVCRSLDFAEIYPFGSALAGNRLVYNVHSISGPDHYGSEIVGINGESAHGEKLFPLLSRNRESREIDVAYNRNGALSHEITIRKKVNQEYLWFLFLLILFANVHLVWGILIRFLQAHSYQAALYTYFSAGLGLFHLCLADLFTFRSVPWLFILSAALLGDLVILLGYNLSGQKMSRRTLAVLLSSAVLLLLYCLVIVPVPSGILAQGAVYGYIITCSLFTMGKLVVGVMRDRNAYLRRRNLTLITAILLGLLVPLGTLLAGLFSDISFPLYLAAGFTIAIPLLMGYDLLRYRAFGPHLFHSKGIVLLFISFLTAIVSATLLYYFTGAAPSRLGRIGYYALFALLLVMILNLKRFLNRRISQVLFNSRDRYVSSLQNVAELVSSPRDVAEKLESIFGETVRQTDVSFLRMVLFENTPDENFVPLERFVEYFPLESDLLRFFSRNRDLILRYSLIKNSPIEDRIYRFLEERSIALVIPVFRGKEVRAALLIGEKNNDVFGEGDIGYLETVSLQLFQLIENDRLFRDYIIKRRYERELDIASYIQLGLFPKKAPARSGLQISFYNRPYLKVTGDYFDFITVDAQRTAIVVGDVSGHGLSAAMILSMTSSIIRGMLKEKKSLEKTVEEINHFLIHRYRGIELITLFIGVFNRRTRELTYINAGHCAPLLIRGKEALVPIEGRSKILGADPAANYFSSRFTLGRHDELVLYTDGLVELFDEETEVQFTEKDLLEVLSQNRDLEIGRKTDVLAERISRFMEKSIRDDITFIIARVL